MIEYPRKASTGAGLQGIPAFPRPEYDKIIEMIDAINSGSGGGIGTTTTLNLSDPEIYIPGTITIPIDKITNGIFICEVDLYSAFEEYQIDNIIRSDGSFGGMTGLCYKSKTDDNAGNDLDNTDEWAFADEGLGDSGYIAVSTFGNPNSLSSNHVSNIRVDGEGFTMLFISGGAEPAIGQLFLDFNTDVEMTNQYSQISFVNVNNVSVKQPAPIQ